jgi:shikimate kinase / 3-dehydroquinate synthase
VASLEPALVFIGFMGAGKTTAAQRAAEATGTESVDADELIERELGMPIAEFFDRHGEAEFRAREAELAGGLLEGADGGAIALGGGAVLSQRVRDALDRHVVVWLDVSLDEAWERASNGSRPLARDRSGFESLYEERRPLYEQVADARMLWASSESGSYPAYFGRDLLGKPGLLPTEGRGFCVSDENVGPLYAERVGVEASFLMAPGEPAKRLETAESIWQAMVDFGLTRGDFLVALGGGVVGDIAGFCAATYQRGIRVVQIPTTLVAQVDSAYGGKTGVDLPQAKNYIGAYHQPERVLVDSGTLTTLPADELRAGFVEALKTGLLAGGLLWERVRKIEKLDPDDLDDVVFESARFKIDTVAADERDAGRRAILNLGHTVGHAIEAASGYERYRHGEAVGLGLLAALRLSGAEELRVEVAALLERQGLPTSLDPAVDTQAVIAAVARDKKRDGEGVGFVLLDRPGEPRYGQRVQDDDVRAAVEELRA